MSYVSIDYVLDNGKKRSNVYVKVYLTTIISGNNILKCLIESDFQACCSGIPPLKLLYFRQVAGK